MRKRRLGRTGLEVSEIVFGGGWVGGILIHQDDETKRKALRRALDGGINFIDTAASYGDGKSEEALGWLLQEVDRTPYLATKFRLDVARLDDLPGQIEQSVEASLKRLQRDSVDLLQLHNALEPETGDGRIGVEQVLGDGGVADVMDRLRAGGVTRFIGVTGLGDPGSVRKVLESGRFDTAQIYYNMINPSAGRAMPPGWTSFDFGNLMRTCREQDVGIMNIRTFAAGVLATDERHGREVKILPDADLAAEERRARAIFDQLGDRFGSRAQTALRFSLANRDLSCVVVGMAELDHLEQALAAAEMGPIPDDDLRDLEALYDRNFELS
jgi:aryl-alcohol dehydrogenase-like predicted oxidoreductase